MIYLFNRELLKVLSSNVKSFSLINQPSGTNRSTRIEKLINYEIIGVITST